MIDQIITEMSAELDSTRPAIDPLEVNAEDDFLYYLRNGSELLRAGDPGHARLALERAAELRPDNAKVQNLLGLSYFKLGLLEAAKEIYDRLLAGYPNETPLYVNLGLVLLRQGRLIEAERSLRHALLLAPDHTRAHCYLGLVLYRRGDLPHSREHFLRGEAPDFAAKVEHKMSALGQQQQPSPSEMLAEVAEAGAAGLDSKDLNFSSVEGANDERVLRNEDAWETKVGHTDSAVSSQSLDIPALLQSASALPAFETHQPEPPTGSMPLEPVSGNMSEDVPEVPEELAFGILPSSINASANPSGVPHEVTEVPELVEVDIEAVDVVEENGSGGLADPMGPPISVHGLGPIDSGPPIETREKIERPSLRTPPVRRGSNRGSFAPPPWILRASDSAGGASAASSRAPNEPESIPWVEPALRLLTDLASTPGFSTSSTPTRQARLVLEGHAHLRASVVLAVSGELSFNPAMRSIDGRPVGTALGGADHPICRIEGHAKALLRVPHLAAVVREVRSLVVVEAALMGFDGFFSWDNRTLLSLDVVHLSGKGTVLVDTPGPLVVAEIDSHRPLLVGRESILAWTDGLTLSVGGAGELDARLVGFSGSGLALFAEREDRGAFGPVPGSSIGFPSHML